ncbi:hypothetical protein TSUD_251300 [Trifolium subterraneum]|uniref:Uncharacterized protein n=1 Tax=Trifolium subterraneum TaxID=3900 RepID=A0A2Z6MXU3_TRISU|nr:hypothetical protein TSUD_251300 [Trifolium subterraneum]
MEGFKKGKWSLDEDNILRAYIADHGEKKWFSIHKMTSLRRSGDSCQERWMKTLRPGLKKGAFTEEEKKSVMELHNQLGDNWAAISQKVPGRTNRDVRQFWKRKMRFDNSNIKFDSRPHFPTYEYTYEDPPQLPPGSYVCFFDEVARFMPLPPAEGPCPCFEGAFSLI